MISYFLVPAGRRYALSRPSVAGWLGYTHSQAVLLPAGVVDMIPSGPPLPPGPGEQAGISRRVRTR